MCDDIWPKCRYGPEGQSGIFQSADEVPEGWADSPAAAEAAAQPVAREAVPLTRKQIMTALTEHGAEFDRSAPTGALYDQLVNKIDATS